jgi:hypothetical protein
MAAGHDVCGTKEERRLKNGVPRQSGALPTELSRRILNAHLSLAKF